MSYLLKLILITVAFHTVADAGNAQTFFDTCASLNGYAYNAFCYYITYQNQSWTDSMQACVSPKANFTSMMIYQQLAVFYTQSYMTTVMNALFKTQPRVPLWLGMKSNCTSIISASCLWVVVNPAWFYKPLSVDPLWNGYITNSSIPAQQPNKTCVYYALDNSLQLEVCSSIVSSVSGYLCEAYFDWGSEVEALNETGTIINVQEYFEELILVRFAVNGAAVVYNNRCMFISSWCGGGNLAHFESLSDYQIVVPMLMKKAQVEYAWTGMHTFCANSTNLTDFHWMVTNHTDFDIPVNPDLSPVISMLNGGSPSCAYTSNSQLFVVDCSSFYTPNLFCEFNCAGLNYSKVPSTYCNTTTTTTSMPWTTTTTMPWTTTTSMPSTTTTSVKTTTTTTMPKTTTTTMPWTTTTSMSSTTTTSVKTATTTTMPKTTTTAVSSTTTSYRNNSTYSSPNAAVSEAITKNNASTLTSLSNGPSSSTYVTKFQENYTFATPVFQNSSNSTMKSSVRNEMTLFTTLDNLSISESSTSNAFEETILNLANSSATTGPTTGPTTTTIGDACSVGIWSDFSLCSASCGEKSVQQRSRNVTKTGKSCSLQLVESKECDISPCNPMSPTAQKIAKAIQTLGCAWLIGIVAATFAISILFWSWKTVPILHVSQEVSLLLAHVIIAMARSDTAHPTICSIVGISLQYLFLVNFVSLALEATHVFAVVTTIVHIESFFSLKTNICFAWGFPLIIVGVTAATSFHKYVSNFSCWLNIGNAVSIATVLPVIICSCLSIILLESAGQFNLFNSEVFDKSTSESAKISQRGLLFILPLNFAAWIAGSMAIYEQNLGLFTSVFALNLALGISIGFFHILANEKGRSFVNNCWKKLMKPSEKH